MVMRIFIFPTTDIAADADHARKAALHRRLRRCADALSPRCINPLAFGRIWAARWRQRRALEDLDNHLLRDIGVTRGEADQEARLPFWRP